MGTLTEILVGTIMPVIIALSFIFGLLIARWAKEELKPGKPYFLIAQHILLAVVLGVIVWNLHKIAAVCSAIILFVILYAYKFKHPAVVGFPLGAALLSRNAIPAIFIYGLVSGTVFKIRKKPQQAILEAILFAVIGFLATAF